jgi:hypothetical protein
MINKAIPLLRSRYWQLVASDDRWNWEKELPDEYEIDLRSHMQTASQ